jgi:hypothetical protein
MRYAKIGAVLYALWGLLHLGAARDEFALGGGLDPGLVQGKIYQGAWNLLFIALASILIAALFNWRNSRLGYWLNLAVASIADIGFLIFIFFPGNVSLIPGIFGPVLWVSAAIFTTIGIRTGSAS